MALGAPPSLSVFAPRPTLAPPAVSPTTPSTAPKQGNNFMNALLSLLKNTQFSFSGGGRNFSFSGGGSEQELEDLLKDLARDRLGRSSRVASPAAAAPTTVNRPLTSFLSTGLSGLGSEGRTDLSRPISLSLR